MQVIILCCANASATSNVPTVSLRAVEKGTGRSKRRCNGRSVEAEMKRARKRKSRGRGSGEELVHVGSHDGDSSEGGSRVPEREGSLQRDLASRLERRSLRTDQHILEVKLDVVLDARHGFKSVSAL